MNLEACVSALARCTFLPGGWDKRFVRNIPADLNSMTEKQRWWLVSLTHRYRRQIPDKLLIQQASEWLANNPKP